MGLETATYIDGLVATNPVLGDPVSAGDDHLRLLKATIKASFPNIAGAVSASHTELSYIAGVTSDVQTQLDSKATTTHSHSESDIADGTILARVGSTENITGQWTFESTPLFSLGIETQQAVSGYSIKASAAGANEPLRLRYQNLDWPTAQRQWGDYFNGTAWSFAAYSDDFSVGKSVFNAIRSGNAITSIEYGNATDNPAHTFRGVATFNDGLVAASASIGNVSNTELQYLDGVTSAIQTQLNGKAAASHSHTESSSFTATLASAATGGTTYTTGTAYYQKNGNAVVLTIPSNFEVAALDGTSFCFIRGLPAAIRSACAVTQEVMIFVLNQGAYYSGRLEVFGGSVDYMRIYPTGAQSTFIKAPSSVCGPAQNATITYRIAD